MHFSLKSEITYCNVFICKILKNSIIWLLCYLGVKNVFCQEISVKDIDTSLVVQRALDKKNILRLALSVSPDVITKILFVTFRCKLGII